MRRYTWWGPVTVLALMGAACGDPCGDAEDRQVPLTELPCSMTNAGIWESHPFPPIADEQCHWLEFRGCSKYEIQHSLGQVPTLIVGYTSFDADGSFSTVASGNSFVVEEANDATVIIRNTQNQLFYLRLALE